MTVPFVWDEHEQPIDFARYTSFGIKYIIEKNGFRIIEQSKSVNNLGVIFQLINLYIYKKISTKNKFANLILTALFISWSNILGILLSSLFPNSNDLYLDNIILAEKI